MESQLLISSTDGNRKFRYSLCDPTNLYHRMIILTLSCLLTFGSYFCYDNPAALQKVLMKELHMSQSSYMGLYSWYSWPNIIMSFVGGLLIDNVIGIRLGTVLFGILTCLGQLVFSAGIFLGELWLMDFGRLVFGIGAESLAVAQNTYAAMWFKDKELNIVFGLQISISRLGSTLNSNTMHKLFLALNNIYPGRNALSLSVLIASSTLFASLLCCIVLGYLDYRASKLIITRSVHSQDSIRLKDIFKFRISLWTLCIVCIAFYSSVFPFVSLAQSFLVQKYNLSVSNANLANSLIYLISAFASPCFGFSVDFFGRNLIWLAVGMGFILLSHILMAFTFIVSPFFITVCLGIAYSMVASSLWGLVTYIVPRSRQGTAYGLMQSLMNLGLGTVSLLAGHIVDNFGYFILELFFIGLTLFGFVALTYVYIWNNNNDNILNESKSKRNKMDAYRKISLTHSD